MLVLSRDVSETICIGNVGTPTFGCVSVVDIRGSKVRLGIEFPRETPVHRGEVLLRILNEKLEAEPTPDGQRAWLDAINLVANYVPDASPAPSLELAAVA